MKHNGIVHNFGASLEKSLKLNEEADWVAFYKRLWPDAVSIVRVDADSLIQRQGIDRMIWLPCNKQILVDEKCRDEYYGDIAIEIVSVGISSQDSLEPKKIGWAIDYKKHCDFIAYAIPSHGMCFMLPFQLLLMTVRHELQGWLRRVGLDARCSVRKQERKQGIAFPIDAENEGYFTRSIGVEWRILKEAINRQVEREFGSKQSLPPVSKTPTLDGQTLFDWAD